MLIINRVLLFAYSLTAGLLGVLFLLFGLGTLEFFWGVDPKLILSEREVLTAIGVFIAFSCYFILWALLCGKTQKKQKEETIVVGKDGGKVHVTLDALRALVEKEALSSISVRQAAVKVELPKGDSPAPFSLKLRLGLVEGANAPQTSATVRSSVLNVLERTLEIGGVDMDITINDVAMPAENKRRVA